VIRLGVVAIAISATHYPAITLTNTQKTEKTSPSFRVVHRPTGSRKILQMAEQGCDRLIAASSA
jgi:hypothetical protein